jgi:hypothetical protein
MAPPGPSADRHDRFPRAPTMPKLGATALQRRAMTVKTQEEEATQRKGNCAVAPEGLPVARMGVVLEPGGMKMFESGGCTSQEGRVQTWKISAGDFPLGQREGPLSSILGEFFHNHPLFRQVSSAFRYLEYMNIALPFPGSKSE